MTTAAETVFCGAKIETDDPELYLWVDGNQKITVDGDFENPRPNAFSLLQISDCPYSTEICRQSCYVHGLEKFAPETHALYKHNSETMRAVLEDKDWTREVKLSKALAEWINNNCTGFRWHVSGDIFSRAYAFFIAEVCARTQGVFHWIYTRSMPGIRWLDLPNLAINISCDADNYQLAQEYATERTRLCYLSHDGKVPEDLPDGSVVFPDYSLRGNKDWLKTVQRDGVIVCPVDFYGKSEKRRCGVCRRCLFPATE